MEPGSGKSGSAVRRRQYYRHRYEKPKNGKKFRWHDGKGRQLTAGGLLPYDGLGVWLVGEQDRGGPVEWTDMGGRYEYEDGDIFKTIAREVGEELYHSAELLRRDIVYFSGRYPPVYVNGHQKLPVYICYPVPIAELLKKGFVLDPELFEENRRTVLSSNPMVPKNYYPTVVLRFFPYNILNRALEGKEECPVLKFRLRRILKQFLPRIGKIEKYHTDQYQKSNRLKDGLRQPQPGRLRNNTRSANN